MAYGIDYRKRAIELLAEGQSCQAVSEILGIDRKTLYNWKNRNEAGCLGTSYPAKRGAYRIDEAELKAHLEEHPDAYLAELAGIAGGSTHGVRHALKRLGISRKKRHPSTESEMKINEQAT
jgi:transposase